MKVLGVAVADAECNFSRELEVFRNEVEAGTRFFFAYLTIHATARKRKEVFTLLNKTPLFWNTCTYALQTASYITLGRVFDHQSPHNIDRVLQQGQSNLQIFSKAALGQRRQPSEPTRPDWLDEFISKAYVPTIDDFRRLRRHVRKWRRIYEANYKNIRDKWFAHKEVAGGVELTNLWGQSQGTNRELQRMFVFLNSLHEALEQLFVNGRKPILRQERYSVARIRKIPSTTFSSGPVQERITRDVGNFLTSMSKVTVSKTARRAKRGSSTGQSGKKGM